MALPEPQCSGQQSPKAFPVCCVSMANQKRAERSEAERRALCLAAAPDLFGCASVVRRVLEGRAAAQRRARVVRRARPVLHLPVRMVAVVPGRFVVRVVGGRAVLRVKAVFGVSPVLGVAF